MSNSVEPHRRQPSRLPRPWDSPGKNTGVGCHFIFQCMKVKSESEVTQSCLTLSDSRDCSLPGSSVHGIFQARVLEWGAIAFSVFTLTCTNLVFVVFLSKITHNRWESKLMEKCSLYRFKKKRLWFLEEVHVQRLHAASLHLTF